MRKGDRAQTAATREGAEEGETVRYRVPEAPWVRSRLEGLSQSPIDHGIQPVHDPMTLTIKPRKTRAGEECERESRPWATERERGGGGGRERTSQTVTVNSARRGFIAGTTT